MGWFSDITGGIFDDVGEVFGFGGGDAASAKSSKTVLDGELGGIASGLGSLSGSLITGLLGQQGQEEANEVNLAIARLNNETAQKIARENNEKEIDLANTAYQRKVKDLVAAGLNPLLAIDGAGSAVPSLAQPTLTSARVENTRRFFDPDAVSKAVGSAKAIAETRNLKKQNENLDATNDLLRAQVENVKANTAKTLADTKYPGQGGDWYRTGKSIGEELDDWFHGIHGFFTDTSPSTSVDTSAKTVNRNEDKVKPLAPVRPNLSNRRMRREMGIKDKPTKPKRKHN